MTYITGQTADRSLSGLSLTLITLSFALTIHSYLAHCTNNDCKTFKGDSGNVWVKIDQLSYNPSGNPPWASDLVREQGAKWRVTIPPSLAPGEYLLRHEILGLHVAGSRMGAQFYPSCTQIRVTQGGSTQLPAGIALPGAYQPDDAGVSFNNEARAMCIAKLTSWMLDFDPAVENQPGPDYLHSTRRPCLEWSGTQCQ